MKNFFLALILLQFFFLGVSHSEIVKKIEIIGDERVTKETIKMFSNINIGDDLNDNDINLILKNLYDTNFFKNISLNLSNGILNIKVLENPIIQTVKINGIKSKDIKEKIYEMLTLKDKNSYVEIFANNDKKQIINALKTSGYYFVEVKSSIEEHDNNIIDLIYDIDLGEKALIKEIIFIGNKSFKDRKLRNIIASEEARFWKFISRKKYLDLNRINLDKRLLKNFYLNKGFYQVKIENSFAQIINDNHFKIFFNINSGDKFYFNNLTLTLPNDYDAKNFKKIKKVLDDLKDKTYSLNKLEKILEEIDKIAFHEQYEFITAQVEENIINGNKIDFNFIISETSKVYVEKINIFGNNVTEERVVRDNLFVDEGDAFNEILHNKSINELKSLGIFKTVKSDISDGTSENTKVIDISIVEKPTGEISAGAGVGTSGGTIGFGIKENNYLGKNIKLKANLAITEDSVRGIFSVTNPNFKYSDKELDISVESTSINKKAYFGYETTRTGLIIGTNYEQYDDIFISPSLSTYYETLDTNSTASENYKKQKGDYFDTTLFYAVDLDKRNQKYKTSEGYRSIFAQDLPLISNNAAIVNSYEFSTYRDFGELLTSLTFFSKAINSINSDKDVRISKRLYLPSSRLRGFEVGKIGPVDNLDFVGGNYASSLNFVASLPKFLPELQDIDFNFFIDAANVWGVDYSSSIEDSNKIRTATGVALDWFTPIGPLNFSLAHPITKANTDRTETFRFNIGTTF